MPPATVAPRKATLFRRQLMLPAKDAIGATPVGRTYKLNGDLVL